MKERGKGSITIFSLLSMVLIVSTLLSLLEGARFFEMKRLSTLQTELALESVFANYNTHLWENYHLLGSDAMAMEELLLTQANGKYDEDEEALNTLIFQVESLQIQSYTLLTDGDGAAYVAVASAYMKNNILYETARNIYSQYESIKSIKESSDMDLSNINEALEEIEEVKSDVEKTSTSVSTVGEADVENPLEVVKDLLASGILELVIQDTDTVSDREIDATDAVSSRSLEVGKNSTTFENDWLDKVLLQQYLLTYMSNYCQEKESSCMAYELEYLIGGKTSDKENLKEVISQLLLIREIANFLYLMNDTASVQAAGILATVLAGGSANVAVVEGVKIGLLTAWAFGESVLDVRALLVGKKIPLLKSQDTWTLDLENIGILTEGYATAKESQWGLSYKDYLGILLLFQDENKVAMHAMDMQEITIQQIYEEPDFRMDQLMINASVEITYYNNPIFSTLEGLEDDNVWGYGISTYADFGYD